MKYIKPINEIWGPVLKRDLLGETREEDKFHTKEELQEYLKSEIKKQGNNVVIQNLDVSLVEDMSELFYRIAYGVRSLDLSGWKTSNVKCMNNMFRSCDALESINLSGWDTSNLKDIGRIFGGCAFLVSLDLSGWDTSNVTDMSEVFLRCNGLKTLDLSGWNTSNVENMNGMFGFCKSLESLDLSGWDTSKAKTMNDMFYFCSAPYKVAKNKKIKKTKSNKSVIFVVNKSNHTIKLCGGQY